MGRSNATRGSLRSHHSKALVDDPPKNSVDRPIEFRHRRTARILQQRHARPAKWFVGIAQQFRQDGVVEVVDHLAGGDGGTHPVVVAIVLQTAAVAFRPETQIRGQGSLLQIAASLGHQDGPSRVGPSRLRTMARLVIALPEAQPIGSAGAQAEPAVEDDQVVPAGGPVQRPAQVDRVQVDQVQHDFVVLGPSKKEIAGVQVGVSNAGLVQMGHKSAQGHRQPLPENGLPSGR